MDIDNNYIRISNKMDREQNFDPNNLLGLVKNSTKVNTDELTSSSEPEGNY